MYGTTTRNNNNNAPSLSNVDAELLEIERQIAMMEARQSGQTYYDKQVETTTNRTVAVAAEEAEILRQIEELQNQLALQTQTSSTTTTAPEKNSSHSNYSSSNNSGFASVLTEHTSNTKSTYSNNNNQRRQQQQQVNDDPIRARAVQKHSWEKPAWAIPTEQLPETNKTVLDEPIQNKLKAPNTGGYERKVFEKNDLHIVKGTFQKPASVEKKPDPRLVWIVVNVNGSKIGKIVMHLHGKCVNAIVDKFLELKGLEIHYRMDGNDLLFYVDDIEPNFYIQYDNNGSSSNHHGMFGKIDNLVLGLVQEGLDIVQKMIEAVSQDPVGTVLTIKQSHIYPVKKTKM